jgi:hypothetical protein
MQWFLGRVHWIGLLSVLALGCGCGSDPQERQREREQRRAELRVAEAAKPPSRRGPVGTLTGQVELAPGAQLPEYSPIDLSRKPLDPTENAQVPPSCAAANELARTPVQLTPGGFLSGVVVAASDFNRMRERAPQVHKVWIENCRLRPVTIAATGGDTLQLINTDEFEFEPLLGPTYRPQGLAQGEKTTFPLIGGGIDSLMCSPPAACGRTDLVVFFHTVHAVTDADGAFQITNFPAAENVRVTAWHPLFEPSETFVWLNPGEHSTVRLVLTPKLRFVTAAIAPTRVSAAPAPPRSP